MSHIACGICDKVRVDLVRAAWPGTVPVTRFFRRVRAPACSVVAIDTASANADCDNGGLGLHDQARPRGCGVRASHRVGAIARLASSRMGSRQPTWVS